MYCRYSGDGSDNNDNRGENNDEHKDNKNGIMEEALAIIATRSMTKMTMKMAKRDIVEGVFL